PCEIHHLCIALCALATLPVVIQIGRAMGSETVALCGAIALIFMPQFLGHAFNNSKDIPFTALFSWSMFSLVMLFQEQKFGWRRFFCAAACIGLTLAVRVGALLLFFYLTIFALVWLAQRRPDNWKAGWRMLDLKKIGVLCAIAWIIMVILWPWA